MRLPAIPNAWTMPIKARIDMLSTGIRTPVGLKINGADLEVIQKIAVEAETHPAAGAGHPQRLCRAHGPGLLPGLRC